MTFHFLASILSFIIVFVLVVGKAEQTTRNMENFKFKLRLNGHQHAYVFYCNLLLILNCILLAVDKVVGI